jgi:hypothetical protein
VNTGRGTRRYISTENALGSGDFYFDSGVTTRIKDLTCMNALDRHFLLKSIENKEKKKEEGGKPGSDNSWLLYIKCKSSGLILSLSSHMSQVECMTCLSE